ncbi:MAG TPA: hypothetical protein VFN45_08600, partial [Myxococcaceae bacterium]|nr:hypothetical protein [Myxococcaceae bacterium]
ATASSVTAGLKPNQQAVTAIPEKLQAAVDQRQGVLALATAIEVARAGQSGDSAKARSGKAEQTGIAKVVEGGATLDAIVPVAEVGEASGALIGSTFGAIDGSVSSLSSGSSLSTGSSSASSGSSSGSLSGTLSSTGSALGTVVGTAVGGSGSSSSSGGSRGSSLGSGSGPTGNLLAPIVGLPLSKKK